MKRLYIVSLFNFYTEYIMWNANLGESQVGIKMAGRNINNFIYVDDTTLMAEREENLNRLLMRVKKKSEIDVLKLNIQKTKIMAPGPITSWKTEGKKVEAVTSFIFLGSKITTDGDCSHEVKRCLLLGRKTMTNIDSMLKRRHITLLTNIHIVKPMVFPGVTYGCEIWIKKKAEHQRIDGFELWCGRRLLLRVPQTGRRSNQSILKEISPEYSLEELLLKLQYFGHLMWSADSLKKTLMLVQIEGKRRWMLVKIEGKRGWERLRCLVSITNSMNVNLNKLQEIMEDRGGRACKELGIT